MTKTFNFVITFLFFLSESKLEITGTQNFYRLLSMLKIIFTAYSICGQYLLLPFQSSLKKQYGEHQPNTLYKLDFLVHSTSHLSRCNRSVSINDLFTNTVGAQSIAQAQSIAHGHIGDNICKKPKFLKNYSYKDKKRSI
jgi:hypothetical protein